MAKRRIFSTEFLQSDNFSDLPFSCQVLYFNLMASADDDGFISGPRRIMRGCNCAEEDLKYLEDEGYLIVFDSGIAVIRHWLIHNHIRKDRHTETVHGEEKAQLELKNGVYAWCVSAKKKQNAGAEKAQLELKSCVYDRREDANENRNVCAEKNNADSVCSTGESEKTDECPQTRQNSGKECSWQDQSVTSVPNLPKRHYFDDTQVNLLFQVFLCLRNEQTGRWDDPETIQMMVDQLNVYSLEQQKILLQDAIANGEKRSYPQSVEDESFSDNQWPIEYAAVG